MTREISNLELTTDVIPVRGSSWADIVAFAATFTAYTHWDEPWEHSDWSQGIPVAEYEEMVRRSSQPNEKVNQVFRAALESHKRTGNWDAATLTELRTWLFIYWRAERYDGTVPEDLTEFNDVLDAIRAKVETRELE